MAFFEALKWLLKVVSLEGNSTCSLVTKKQVEMASKEGEKCRVKWGGGEHSTKAFKKASRTLSGVQDREHFPGKHLPSGFHTLLGH